MAAGFEIVSSDGADLPATTRALYVGGTVDIQVTFLSGVTVTLKNVLNGWHPIRVQRV